jgi:hypothetical protein
LRNWVALTRYSGDSRLKIDNNGTEQALRPIVQINPFVYLRDVIERVSTHPARLVLELTPCEWKRLHLDSGAHAAA